MKPALLARIVFLFCALSLHAGTPLRILVVGGHPDDPETCAGGLIALASSAGHRVTVAYLTTGEAGIPGKSHEEAAAIRRAEALEACRVLGATPVFLGQIDGATVVDSSQYQAVARFINEQQPDLVITHWPIDTHPDHRACSNLVFNAWYWGGKRFPLYYMEAMTGHQTLGFQPTDRIEISRVASRKREACFAHRSQDISEATYDGDLLHGQMERQRGREAGETLAEAYVRQDQSVAFDFSTLVVR
ncbi:PIG-L deacetylase family protein [Nibricoccus sp. IMCC34717]|uniref:PIG-L deacetylase family protein n=1 Tax=Nibricoccus sp. IMCC34717 TaxID=3034021 RepID=UPI00384EAD9D